MGQTLNPIYHTDSHNPLKKQVTFANKGQDVIKDLDKYLQRHPEKEPCLRELVNYLRRECVGTDHYEDGTINWLVTLVHSRDEVAHYGKSEWFAFQVTNAHGTNSAYPPRMSPEQSLSDAMKNAYENLLTLIQDFTALSLSPYLDKSLCAFTFREDEVHQPAPKWYIILCGLQQFGLKSIAANPFVAHQFCQLQTPSIDPIQYMQMHMYYSGFLKS